MVCEASPASSQLQFYFWRHWLVLQLLHQFLDEFYFMIYLSTTLIYFLRTPIFSEDVGGEDGDGEVVKPPERSFWAKYVSYLIPPSLKKKP